MRRYLPRYLLAVLLLLICGGGFVLLFPDKVAESLRPWLERVAAEHLNAQVRIGRIVAQSLLGGRIAVDNLRIEREGEWRLSVPHLQAKGSLSGLLAGHLDILLLEQPTLAIADTTDSAPTALTDQPPLRIDRLEVIGGELQLNAAGRTWGARDIGLTAELASRSPFHLTARVGEGVGLSLQAVGELTWPERALTLQQLRWEERDLLPSPLTVTLPAAVGPAAEGARSGSPVSTAISSPASLPPLARRRSCRPDGASASMICGSIFA